MILALSLSLLAHGVTGVCTYTLMGHRRPALIPAFPDGDSCLSVSLLSGQEGSAEPVEDPVPAPVAAEPEPVPVPAPVPEAAMIAAEETPEPEDVAMTVDPSDSPVGAPDPGVVVAEVRPTSTPAADRSPTGHGGANQEPGSSGDASSKAVRSSVVGLGEIQRHYPLGSRTRGEEGVVTVKAIVNARGRAEKVDVAESSNFPSLDQAAVKAAKNARYVGGRGEIVLSFRFKLIE
jgi:protein TonB